MAVHIVLSCTPGIPLGVLSSLKRRIGDFFTNSTTVLHLSPFQRTKPPLMRIGLMGALAGLLILSTPLHKFLTTTLVITLVMVPAMISAVATQVRKRISRVSHLIEITSSKFLHQDYRLVASTATCGTYAIVLAFSAFFQ